MMLTPEINQHLMGIMQLEVNQIQFIQSTVYRSQSGFVLFVDGINNFTTLQCSYFCVAPH
jgi:hypothetical protein